MRNTLILISILLNITCIWAQTSSASSQGHDTKELYRVVPFSETERTEYDTNSVRTIIDAIDRYLAEVSAIIATMDTLPIEVNYSIDGNRIEKTTVPIKQGVEEEQEDGEIFTVVEKMPEFPGGQAELFKFLSENTKYPVMARENGIEGRVICQFVVNKDGSIADIHVIRSGGDASLDKEAIRVIKSMPKWNPGMQYGKAVRVKYTVPVNFRQN